MLKKLRKLSTGLLGLRQTIVYTYLKLDLSVYKMQCTLSRLPSNSLTSSYWNHAKDEKVSVPDRKNISYKKRVSFSPESCTGVPQNELKSDEGPLNFNNFPK